MPDFHAEVILDSIGKHSPRLTTFQLRYPKFIHGEFMTHRQFSRNASSSRAVPVSKNLEEVRSDVLRAGPVYWGAEQKGMQSGEELNTFAKVHAQLIWEYAARDSIIQAEQLVKYGVHKSIVNRVIEPFLHINVVMTSCEDGLLNFFGLRLDKAAQPEIRHLAEMMWKAWNESNSQKLSPGQWHTPYIDDRDLEELSEGWGTEDLPSFEEAACRASTARCARVSYLSFETGRRSSLEEDLKLYKRLVGAHPMHASPAEHQATPDVYITDILGNIHEHIHFKPHWKQSELASNLSPGWIQYRKLLEGEAVAPLPEGYEYVNPRRE